MTHSQRWFKQADTKATKPSFVLHNDRYALNGVTITGDRVTDTNGW